MGEAHSNFYYWMKESIKILINEIVLKAKEAQQWPDFDMPEIIVDYPRSEQFGDYTSNIAMILAKKVGKNPMEIAESLKAQILDLNAADLDEVEVAEPGYLNFYLNKEYFQTLVEQILKEKSAFGSLQMKEKKVIVEYSQPNTHKEFHIGHLRNVFIGNSLVNVLKKNGNKVTAANYIGDTGSHIAKCLWGILKFHADVDLDQVENKAEFLGRAYSEAVKAISENSEYEEQFKALQNRFENGDEQLLELWEKTKQWSMDEFQKIYEQLGVKFDVYFWESEEELEGKKLLPELLKIGCIQESQGAIVANLEEYGLGVLVLVRKDGSALYGLKDIPLAIKKFREFDIDKSIVVVDIRQGLYFKQIFKILEIMGFKNDMQHVGYEFVSLKGSESMSSRKGNIIPATFLIDEIIKKVEERFPEAKAAEEIGIGALKFYMLKYSAQSKIEFDIDEAIKLEGASGPYVQYAHARICSIIAKAKEAGYDAQETNSFYLSLLTHEKEYSLIKELNKFSELVEEVANSYEIHKLPHYALKLADKFHSFYDACRVIDNENPELTKARLFLADAVRIVLAETLALIGVSAPEKM